MALLGLNGRVVLGANLSQAFPIGVVTICLLISSVPTLRRSLGSIAIPPAHVGLESSFRQEDVSRRLGSLMEAPEMQGEVIR